MARYVLWFLVSFGPRSSVGAAPRLDHHAARYRFPVLIYANLHALKRRYNRAAAFSVLHELDIDEDVFGSIARDRSLASAAPVRLVWPRGRLSLMPQWWTTNTEQSKASLIVSVALM